MTTKELDELHAKVREKWATGEYPIAEMLALREAKKVDNHYATRFNVPNGVGLDGVVPPPRESNLIAFATDHEVYFLAEDAETVNRLILAFAADMQQSDAEYLAGDGSVRMTLARVRKGRAKLEEKYGVPHVTLWRVHWNDWVYTLYRCGVGLDVYYLE